ncbi:hypothetical protein AB0K52_22425 [Glycomyces sp. NPDC049804]|uniref:hypothetical protein n=1 Tax=Glycomyces sp. NPDC049804 TaxID=3154363 RepID=UPI00343F623D
MRQLDRLNAVPGTPSSALQGAFATLPRLVFEYSRATGFSAMPTPLRFPLGKRSLQAFAAWAKAAGHYQLVPGPDPRRNGNFECRVFIDSTEVRVWVPIDGMTVQAAINCVDNTCTVVARG